LLQKAGQDPVMHAVQDQFFDANYWSPAAQSAAKLGISSALGASVVYDSHVQGAWGILRDRTIGQFGAVGVIGENDWVSHYVTVRRDWLATNSNPALHPTVYRMDCFLALIQGSHWDLPLPIEVRSVTIDAGTLGGATPARILSLTAPPMTGEDVRAVQQALMAAGANLTADGVFGSQTQAAVRQFQLQQGLAADGIVGPGTRSALGL
jgi:chitosanase